MMMFTGHLVLTLAGSTALIPQDDGALRTQSFDLRFLREQWTPGQWWLSLALPIELAEWQEDAADPYWAEMEEPETIDASSVRSELADVLPAIDGVVLEALDEEHGRLVARGNDRALSMVAAVVDALGGVVDERAEVRLYQLPPGSVERGAVMTPEAVGRLIEGGSATLLARQRTPFGVNDRIGASGAISYAASMDVEVAHGAFAFDQRIQVLGIGDRWVLNLDRSGADGQILVRCLGRRDDLIQPIREHVLEQYGRQTLELPEVVCAAWAVSGSIMSGGGLVVRAGEDGLLLQVIAPGREARGVAVHDLRELFGECMRLEPFGLPYAEPSSGREPYDDALAEDSAPWLDSALRWGLTGSWSPYTLLEEAAGIESIRTSAVELGSMLFVLDDAVSAEVTTFQREFHLETYGIQVAYGLVETQRAADVLTAEGRSRFLEGEGTQRLVVSCLEGDTASIRSGIERAYIREYAINMSQSLFPPSPTVSSVFDGIAFWCSPAARLGETLSLNFDITFHAEHDPFRTLMSPLQQPDSEGGEPWRGGYAFVDVPLELPVSRRAASRGQVSARLGEWELLTVQAVAETGSSFVAFVRVEARD